MYRWDGAGLVECAEPTTTPDVVDSWLVQGGHVAHWHLHVARFGHPEFMAAVRVPAEGAWFPRVEKHGEELYLRVRPAPPLRTQTVLWVPPTPDPRLNPTVKGPDLGVLGELRAQAQALGADDAVLWTGDGLVAEGANCALAWWEDGHLMFPEHPEQLPSTTVQATREAYSFTGTRPITPEELQTFPVWAGSALHGWTEVVGWV
ncbi:MAG: aminotransferase class IV [Corynebacterium sp.]|uniref:aminotransferase class IV n=1 Tax=Corynebacterium sp. TaxID=1720 RepID=UPI0026E0FD2C|nr:aminotransferase class IV [Corynebacterium sp.]MDO5668557.1 aminotransferase class IV [Corynebacterium sp.]